MNSHSHLNYCEEVGYGYGCIDCGYILSDSEQRSSWELASSDHQQSIKRRSGEQDDNAEEQKIEADSLEPEGRSPSKIDSQTSAGYWRNMHRNMTAKFHNLTRILFGVQDNH